MARLRDLFPRRRDRDELDLDRELRHHLDQRTSDLMAEGLSEAEAHRRAAIELGGLSRVKEEVRDGWVWRWADQGRRDFTLAARMLTKSPGFAVTVVLTLALAIGTTASVSGVAEPLLTRPLPVDRPEDLVLFRTVNPSSPNRADYIPGELYRRLRADSSTLSGILASEVLPDDWTARRDDSVDDPDEMSVRFQTEVVTGNYFRVLGVRPVLGRPITDADEDKGAPVVAVISHRLWRQQFGRDPDIVGTTIRLTELTGMRFAGIGVTVVGVAPSGFSGVDLDHRTGVWIPLRAIDPAAWVNGTGLDAGDLRAIGRMRPGVELDAVNAEIDVLVPQLTARTFAVDESGVPNVRVEEGGRGYSALRFEFSQPVLALAVGVGLVLLIAWANAAALMVARATARERETAVRLALGSSRRGLLGLFVAEGLILSCLGAVGGILLARAGADVMKAYLPPESGLATQVGLSGPTLLLACGLTIAGAFVLGLVPAMKTSGVRNISALTGLPGPADRRRGVFKAHRIVVVSQIALSLVLLVGAALFLQTLRNLRSLESGFEEEKVLEFWIETPRSGRLNDFFRSGRRLIGDLPGVDAVTSYSGGLTEGPLGSMLGVSPGSDRETVPAVAMSIDPGFLNTTRIPLVSGRMFTERDGNEVVILSRVLARRLFGDTDPIGRTAFIGTIGFPSRPPQPRGLEVVGVVGDIRTDGDRDSSPIVYFPEALPFVMNRIAVRTSGEPGDVVPRLRRTVEEFDPGFRLAGVQTLRDARESAIAPERFVSDLAAVMSLAALALVAVGLFGAFAYAAARRRAEVALRMALGAEPNSILSLMMREVLSVLGVGLALGLGLTLAATRLLSGILFGVVPMDPASVLAAALILASVSVSAAYVPVRWASRLDPMVVLRHD